jgi:hypothetical protein
MKSMESIGLLIGILLFVHSGVQVHLNYKTQSSEPLLSKLKQCPFIEAVIAIAIFLLCGLWRYSDISHDDKPDSKKQ